MSKPNVVVIVADDLGYGDVGVFNAGRSHTPYLNDLATSSLLLSQHFSGAPVCAPARASLLTGRYHHRTGAVDTLEARGLDRLHLRERTIADFFGAAGYVTGMVGKWHNGAIDPRYHPTQRGFDEFVGFLGGGQDYYEWTLDDGRRRQDADGRYLTDVFTAEAVAFIRRHQSEPFFLYVAYNAPHTPLQAPAHLVDRYRNASNTTAVATLYAMIEKLDSGVGAILGAIAGANLTENTIVLFTSDNGPQFAGEGDACTVRFNCGLNGSKCLVYEGGIRVPAIVRWPAGLPDGHRNTDYMAHMTDWLPTLAAACRVSLAGAAPLDGMDILPVLKGEPHKAPEVRFWQWTRYRPMSQSNAAMRDGSWKLVLPAILESLPITPEDLAIVRSTLKSGGVARGRLSGGPSPKVDLTRPPQARLFNLDIDPSETQDLAAAYPERRARMEQQLAVWFDDVTSGSPWQEHSLA